jgi:hypothetical protein
MCQRSFTSKIILTVIPHLLSLFSTFDNILYSSIIITSTITSILWHRYKEPNNILLILDYSSASILSSYEIYNSYYVHDGLFMISLLSNIYVLFFNKIVYFLSKNKVINYNLWHSFYHILSSIKTITLAFLICNLQK